MGVRYNYYIWLVVVVVKLGVAKSFFFSRVTQSSELNVPNLAARQAHESNLAN